jgi:hypothetical protein
MNSRILLCAFLIYFSSGLLLAGEGQPGSHRSESPDGAAVGFANMADGDVLPPRFLVEFSITGMGIAPAGVEIDNTGHHHLLIDVAELPDLNQPLPASDNIRHFGKGQSQTELQLPEGQHSLQLLLADHAHIAHNPPVMSDVIVIVVSADAPPPD